NPGQESYGAPTYTYNSIIAIDCSGSMKFYDPIMSTNVASLYDSLYYSKTCQRIKAVQNFINNMNTPDKAGIVLFSSDARLEASMTNNAKVLKSALQKISDDGGTSFYNALSKSYKAFDESSLGKNNTFNRIILLSDGGDGDYSSTMDLLDSIYYNGSTDKRKEIKIFTIGLGASYDSRLEEIASISGGEFYKAYSSEELINILKKEGFNTAFDTTDTDNDGLYDAVEFAGIRLQNGKIIYGCDPYKKDTDTDGLTDGQEIDPTIRIKSTYWCTPEVEDTIGRSYYFVMKSDPVNDDDTDKDGYSDIEDPYPNNKPELIGDKYDFLDGEIYEIEATDTGKPKYLDVQKASPAAGTSVIVYDHNGHDNQKFKFEWCGTGYKIHSLINEDLVLTMSLNSSGEGNLYMDYDNNMPDQIWEVVPYFNNDMARDNITTTGLVIRSKVLYYENENSVGQPLYINYTDDETYISTKRAYGARFVFYNITSWKRFGKMYMKHLGWLTDDNSKAVNRALDNYKHNTIELGQILKKNKYSSKDSSYSRTGCINGQQNFSNLRFADTSFGNVGCEVLATYNAMIRSNANVDLCKLIVEFEANALQITGPLSDGVAGSKPNKIVYCLKAYFFDPHHTAYYIFPLNPDRAYDLAIQNEMINEIQNQLDSKGKVIISAWNHNNGFGMDIFKGVHTVY
ncbi:MAG: VWA domain-containing protein, partial [Clostridia bacterium]|nr:VWA domain-containing protein [Clostridia bacterium]